jgi:hypothetical protein
VIIVIALPPLVVLSRLGTATGGRTRLRTVKTCADDRRAQLVEGDLLDLSNALGAHTEDASELAQRARRPVEAESLGDDPLLAVLELIEERPQLRGPDVGGHPVVGVLGGGIDDEVAEGASTVCVAADRLLQTAGPALGGDQPLHLLASETGAARELRA